MDKRNLYQLYHNNSLVAEEDLSLLDSALVESMIMGKGGAIEKEMCALPTMEVKVEKFCELLSDFIGKKVTTDRMAEFGMHGNVKHVGKYPLHLRKAKHVGNDDIHSRSSFENEILLARPATTEVVLPTIEVKVEKFCGLPSAFIDKTVTTDSMAEYCIHGNVKQVGKYPLRLRKAKHVGNDDIHCRFSFENAIVLVKPATNEGRLDVNGIDNTKNLDSLSVKEETMPNHKIDSSIVSKVIPFCETCNKFFISEENLIKHKKSQNNAKKILNVFPCDICNRTFVTSAHYRKHNGKHRRKDKFACADCEEQFMYEVDLRKHELFVHDKKSLLCRICSKVLFTANSLERHEERCDAKTYPCGVCSKVLPNWHELKDHEVTHTNDRPYTCDICGNKFKTVICLRNHQRTHNPEKIFPCARCEEKFATLNQLRMHSCVAMEKMTVMPGIQPFMCGICEQGFVEKLLLVEHMQIHGVKKRGLLEKGRTTHTCGLCGLKLSRKWTLAQHEKSVHGIRRPFECDLCNERFETGIDLSQHKKEAHAEERLYMCGVCKKTFLYLKRLERHQVIHFDNRPYKCTLCDKSFRSKCPLKRHELQHGGKHRFECQQCQKKFFTNSHLRHHLNTHNAVKPFACSTCNKGFTSKNNLKAHSYVHTGDKQYKCSKCTKGFSTNRVLQKHMLQH